MATEVRTSDQPEPVVVAVFDGISTALEDVATYGPIGVKVIGDFFKGIPGWFGNAIGGFVGGLGSPGGGHAAGGQMMAGGWTTVGEVAREIAWQRRRGDGR